MKKIILGILMAVSFYSNAQEYILEEKSVTGIFEANGKTKAELFSAINKWISDNYKSANSVIQLNDAEGGNIIIEGITEGKFNLKPFWPKLKRDKYEIVKFNHLIELNIVDNKLKMIYKITNLANLKHSKAKTECSNECDINTLNCINFNGVDDNSIVAYNEFLESIYRRMSTEKIKIYKSLSKPMFEELNSNLISNIKGTMESIAKSTTATSNGS
jgi:hypothetical protein